MVVLLLGYGWCGVVSATPPNTAIIDPPSNLNLGALMLKSMEVFCRFRRFALLSGMPVLATVSLNLFLLDHLPDNA